MISRLVIELSTKSRQIIDYNIGSALQGVLMNVISNEYADILHKQSLNPYSQYFYKKENKLYWVINTLTKEARDNIILVFLENELDEFYVKYKSEKFIPRIMEVRDILYENFLDIVNKDKLPSYISINFITPTAFKSNGEYKFMPDVKWIINSLVNKFKLFSNVCVHDELTEKLIKKIKIMDYSLKSTRFNLEGVKIPSFMGNIRFNLSKCNEEEKAFAHLIFNFGKYSGVGIKTSMGMGAMDFK